MSKKDALVVGLLIAVGIVIILCVMKEKEEKIEAENEELKKKLKRSEANRIALIQDSIRRNPELSDVIESQLLELADQFRNTSPKIASAIHQALELYQLGRKEDAIADLAKIMENLLKHHYQHHIGFNNWLGKRPPTFHMHLEYCHKEDKRIDEVEFQFYRAVKTVRNKEAHELNVSLEDNISSSGILSAISGIVKLSSLAYPT